MSDSPQPVASSSPQWWLSKQGIPDGPHSEAYILAGLQTGTISPQTYACPVGGQQWKRLCEWPTFASASPAPPSIPPPPPPPPPAAAPPVARPAWNPRSIAWLGLLFSPIWTGIMATINARRLRSTLPIWRPLAIGVGATALDFLPFDSYIFDMVLYLGAIGLIWFLDLAPQVPMFERGQAENGRQAGWIVPGLLGSPITLLVFFMFVVAPLLPLEPREVCNRFIKASSERELKKYATANMRPVIDALSKLPDEGRTVEYELTDEGDAPSEVGGYLVGFRMVVSSRQERDVDDGCFHLVRYDGPWKIEEMYLTAINGEKSEPWVAVSKKCQQLQTSRQESPGTASNFAAGASPSCSSSGKPPDTKKEDPWVIKLFPSAFRNLARFVYGNFGGTGIVILFILVAAVVTGMQKVKAIGKN